MILELLDSHYWHARWSGEVWAQWPQGDRMPRAIKGTRTVMINILSLGNNIVDAPAKGGVS